MPLRVDMPLRGACFDAWPLGGRNALRCALRLPPPPPTTTIPHSLTHTPDLLRIAAATCQAWTLHHKR